uniref:Uncharacterized protein n=1 Tax=Tanacetum cinerariifolium TaxID=118510 RepID=A0A6L2KHP1_TANCI|nr:hypothetical protein [Tanacetum cinerariifolium]
MVKHLDGGVNFLMYPRFVQVFLDNQVKGMDRHNVIFVISTHTKNVFANMKREGTDFSEKVTLLFQSMMVQAPEDMGEGVPTTSNDPLPSGEDRMQLNELMILCTNLQKQVLDLDEAKTAQAKEITSLKKRVKKLEQKGNMFGVNDLDGDEVVMDVSASKKEEQSVKVVFWRLVLLIQLLLLTLIEIKAAKPKAVITTAKTVTAAGTRPKEKGIVMQEPSKTPSPKPIISSQKPSQAKDKRKGKMVEPKRPLKRKDHIMMDAKVAKNLEAQMQDELEEEERLARHKKEETNIDLILFNNTIKWIEAFVLMDTEKKTKGYDKAVEGSEKAKKGSSKRAGSNLEQEDAKRQRIEEENELQNLKDAWK